MTCGSCRSRLQISHNIVSKTLGVLTTLAQCIDELRNLYGTGHGKDVSTVSLEPRNAALGVNVATTLALLLYQSYEKG